MPYPKGYRGRLEVEDEAFELRAERFSVRTRDEERTGIVEVAFRLECDGNTSWIEGVSAIVPDGRYVSGPLPVRWEREYAGVDAAEIVLTRVEETPKGCKVDGEWREYGDCYRFSGLLKPFLAQT